jgi:D-methionine transport system ATP-binding protein
MLLSVERGIFFNKRGKARWFACGENYYSKLMHFKKRGNYMIDIQNLSKVYKTKNGTVNGVDDVSLTVQRGEIYGIVGYSGAGKSSLLRCINLLERPTSGSITVDGIDLTSQRGENLRLSRLKIGMIFQHFY